MSQIVEKATAFDRRDDVLKANIAITVGFERAIFL
jgi:hypothetical protein